MVGTCTNEEPHALETERAEHTSGVRHTGVQNGGQTGGEAARKCTKQQQPLLLADPEARTEGGGGSPASVMEGSE